METLAKYMGVSNKMNIRVLNVDKQKIDGQMIENVRRIK